MDTQLTISLRDVIIYVVCPLVAAVVGVWVRLEVRTARLEVSMEDIKRLVLNGHKKTAARARRK